MPAAKCVSVRKQGRVRKQQSVRKLAQQSAERLCKPRKNVASTVVRCLRWHPALQQRVKEHQLPEISHPS